MSCLIGFLSCFLLYFLSFQRESTGGSMDRGRGSPLVDALRTATPSATRSSCQCNEYLSRIADLEGRLYLMKRQARTAMDQASKSYGQMKQMSVLEYKFSSLVAQVMHLKECDSFLVDFIESACEQLKCKFPVDLLEILVASLVIVFS
jgi:hypothetical protein